MDGKVDQGKPGIQGPWPVSVSGGTVDAVIPGVSTAANQVTSNGLLVSIDAKTPALVGGRQPVDGSGVTQPIGFVNRIVLLPLTMAVSTEGSRLGYRLVWNPTLTGAVWTSVSTASGAEFDVAATAAAGGETLLRAMLGQTNDATVLNISQLFDELGRKVQLTPFGAVQQIVTIMAVNEATGSANVRASLAWREIR